MAKSIPKKLFQIFRFMQVVTQMVEAQEVLKVSSNRKQLKLAFESDTTIDLVELKSVVPNIRYDLKYATK